MIIASLRDPIFTQEKSLEGAFFDVIAKTDGSFAALVSPQQHNSSGGHAGRAQSLTRQLLNNRGCGGFFTGTARAPYTALAIAARGLCRIENNDIINYVSIHEVCVSMV